MSKDPLEELFGPLDADSDETTGEVAVENFDDSSGKPSANPARTNADGEAPEAIATAPLSLPDEQVQKGKSTAANSDAEDDWMNIPLVLPQPPAQTRSSGNIGSRSNERGNEQLFESSADPAIDPEPHDGIVDADGDSGAAADSSVDSPTHPFNPFPEPAPEPAQATVEELFPDAVVLPAATRAAKPKPDDSATSVLDSQDSTGDDPFRFGDAPLASPSATPFAAPAGGSAASGGATPPSSGREELPTRPVPAGGNRLSAALPWIIIGVVAVALLIGALLFVNSMKGSEPAPEPTPEAPVSEEPTETPPTEVSEEPSPEPEPTPEATKAPEVEVSGTVPLQIVPAGISVDVPYELDPMQWYAPGGDTNLVTWESNIMNSFPDSCAAMRSPSMQSPWGIEQDEAGEWVVVRPEGTCEADPELYNEVWGLMQALADSAKPLGSD